MRLIDADALIQHTYSAVVDGVETDIIDVSNVDNAPTVEGEILTKEAYSDLCLRASQARLQGVYVDISKLRLMTVEECAGHTIDYAMGWKACVEWIKKGGAE